MNRRIYSRLRAAGCTATESARTARIAQRFDELESDGLVRIVAEPEYDSYFSVFGEPEGYVNQHGRRISAEQERKELCDSFERDGVWCVLSQWRDDFDSEWQTADSVGMCAGYSDPTSIYENCYVPDLMQAAIAAVEMNSASYSI